MSCVEKHDIVNSGQTSVSYIEKILNHSLIRLKYDFRLCLQTEDNSIMSDIYFNADDLESCFIKPISELIYKDKTDYSVTIENNIQPNEVVYYKLTRILKNKLSRRLIKLLGCKIQLKIDYYRKNNNIFVDYILSYKSLLFIHTPKEIQPSRMVFTLAEFENFLSTLEYLI